jgi:hypothetical protein
MRLKLFKKLGGGPDTAHQLQDAWSRSWNAGLEPCASGHPVGWVPFSSPSPWGCLAWSACPEDSSHLGWVPSVTWQGQHAEKGQAGCCLMTGLVGHGSVPLPETPTPGPPKPPHPLLKGSFTPYKWCMTSCAICFVCVLALLFCIETGSHSVVEAGLKLLILLPPPPQCWDYRSAPPTQPT